MGFMLVRGVRGRVGEIRASPERLLALRANTAGAIGKMWGKIGPDGEGDRNAEIIYYKCSNDSGLGFLFHQLQRQRGPAARAPR